MTAPEVPVEELIGWSHTGKWATLTENGMCFWLDDGDPRKRAEVDDLADWLMDRGWVEIICDKKNGKRLVTAFRPDLPECVAEQAPTIRAALEAAVRAVHEQENR